MMKKPLSIPVIPLAAMRCHFLSLHDRLTCLMDFLYMSNKVTSNAFSSSLTIKFRKHLISGEIIKESFLESLFNVFAIILFCN